MALLVFFAGAARAGVVAADLGTGPHDLTHGGMLVMPVMIVIAVWSMHVLGGWSGSWSSA